MSMGFMGVGRRPPMVRSRSKSEAELSSALRFREHGSADGAPVPRRPPMSSGNTSAPTTPTKRKPRQGSNGEERERWVYKGKCDLVDLEVVVTPAHEDSEWRYELLSPEVSFAVYAC